MNTQATETPNLLQQVEELRNWQPPKLHNIRIEEIATKPIWSVCDLSLILDVPTSTLNEVIKDNPAPFFLLGRRKVIFREDALQWLREVAARNPWTPRKNTQAQKS